MKSFVIRPNTFTGLTSAWEPKLDLVSAPQLSGGLTPAGSDLRMGIFLSYRLLEIKLKTRLA